MLKRIQTNGSCRETLPLIPRNVTGDKPPPPTPKLGPPEPASLASQCHTALWNTLAFKAWNEKGKVTVPLINGATEQGRLVLARSIVCCLTMQMHLNQGKTHFIPRIVFLSIFK